MSGAEPFVPVIAQIASSVLNYFKQKREDDKDAIRRVPHGILRESNTRPLVDMHADLLRADTELDLYFTLLANSAGSYKDILVNNQSQFFFDRILKHIDSFKHNFDILANGGVPELLEAIKGHSGLTVKYYNDIDASMNQYTLIAQSGGRYTAADITKVVQTFRDFTLPYINSIGMTLGDLPHTRV